MRISGKIKETFYVAGILLALILVLGNTAHARGIFSTSSLNFGTQSVGTTSAAKTVTVTNTSFRAITIASISVSAAQFSYSGQALPITLNRGQSLTASVKFTPTANQSYVGTLVFTAEGGATTSVALSGAGGATTTPPTTGYTINATPSLFSFASTAGGAASASQSVVIDDTTPNPLSFTISADQPWIVLSAAAGATKATLQFGVNTANLAAGTYSGHVLISASGVVNSPLSVPVTLTVSSGATTAPKITTQPISKTVKVGQTASFSVAAIGSSPIAFQWSKNGTPVTGGTSSTFVTPPATTSDNAAKFTVDVTNSMGAAASTPATLTVSNAPAALVAPSITTQPSSQTVTAGQTATFTVATTGTAPITYQWAKNGTPVSGATSSTYTTPSATSSDNAAQFTVAVANSAGSATSSAAILTVSSTAAAPKITTQPSSQTVTAGKAATFTVAATGTGPITYQWTKNGTAISGATSSTYATPATTTSDNAAQLTAVATNSAGSATSSAATLTVSAATVALKASATSLNFGSVNLSSTSTQTVTLTNSGNSNITISNVSVSGAGFNASGVSTGLILAAGQTATLTTTFTPSTAGSAAGSVTIASNAASDTITLSGTGLAAATHSVVLSWTASSSAVTGYNTYSSNVTGGPYNKVNSSQDTSTTYTDNTVQAGKTYFYVVTSVDSSNVESAQSSEISATIP